MKMFGLSHSEGLEGPADGRRSGVADIFGCANAPSVSALNLHC